ncbi:MAG: hypothetical protein LBR64_08550 [Dysgonamonadaceae bacterium]|nr:hypothetical protein [Dysgonamonadaceae bacterium]
MKRFFGILFGCLIFAGVNAQIKVESNGRVQAGTAPTAASNDTDELNYFLPRTDACMSILNYKYWFDGDTIINNVRYTKIYRQKCQSEAECGELSYFAAVREDTVNEKIYAVYPCDRAVNESTPTLFPTCDEVLSGAESSRPVNVSNWTAGIYLVRLYDGNTLVYSGKFLKY